MNEKDLRTADAITERLTKLIRIGWVIAAGAFIVGGWVVKLQLDQAAVHEKISKQETSLKSIETSVSALADKVTAADKSLAEVKASTYTLREAREITDRLIVLETQSRAQADQLREALDDLKVILQRQASL
jgi:roadblock/LC7 domain-containing protein